MNGREGLLRFPQIERMAWSPSVECLDLTLLRPPVSTDC